MTDSIAGDRVVIHPTAEHDLPDLLRLWNDGRVMKWVGFPDGLGYDLQQVQEWLRRMHSSPNCHHFVFHVKPLGFCGELYYAVDTHRRAGLDIKLVPEAWGKGLATEALTVFIGHIFKTEPAVQAVWTEPSEENGAARRLYERCGLRPVPRPADMEPGYSYWELRREG